MQTYCDSPANLLIKPVYLRLLAIATFSRAIQHRGVIRGLCRTLLAVSRRLSVGNRNRFGLPIKGLANFYVGSVIFCSLKRSSLWSCVAFRPNYRRDFCEIKSLQLLAQISAPKTSMRLWRCGGHYDELRIARSICYKQTQFRGGGPIAETYKAANIEARKAVMRLRFAVVGITFLLCDCRTPTPEISASKPDTKSSEHSAVGTIASNAGAGAFYATEFTVMAGADCHDSLCAAFSLLMGAILIPAGTLVGAGVGVIKAVAENESNKNAEWENAVSGSCPDPRVADWRRECQKLQGPIPDAPTPVTEGSNGQTRPNSALDAWFDACGAALKRKWDSIEHTRVPEICRSGQVPSWSRVECLQKSAAVKKDRELNLARFEFERSRLERGTPFKDCFAELKQ